MGYNTFYTLRIHANPDVQLVDEAANHKVAELINKFLNDEKEFDYSGIFEDLSEGNNFVWSTGDSYKWYDHDLDMRKLSLMVPDVVLTLSGVGEDDDDKWIKYYLNGKSQYARAQIVVTYPEFDPERLS